MNQVTEYSMRIEGAGASNTSTHFGLHSGLDSSLSQGWRGSFGGVTQAATSAGWEGQFTPAQATVDSTLNGSES